MRRSDNKSKSRTRYEDASESPDEDMNKKVTIDGALIGPVVLNRTIPEEKAHSIKSSFADLTKAQIETEVYAQIQ